MTDTILTDPLSHWMIWTVVALAAACFAGFQLARICYGRTSGRSSQGQSSLSQTTHDAAYDLEGIARDLEVAIDRWQTSTVGITSGSSSGTGNGPSHSTPGNDAWGSLVGQIRTARGDICLQRQTLQQTVTAADPLTSPARGKAEMAARIESLLSLQLRYDQSFSLALLRTSGEPQHLGATITAQVRETDLVARYDDQTFSVVMPQTGPDAACQLIERIRDLVETNVSPDPANASPTHVFGGVATADCQDNVESLLARAETAAGQAKSQGSNRIHHHNGRTTLLVPAGFTMQM
jgi:hypothetical protein